MFILHTLLYPPPAHPPISRGHVLESSSSAACTDEVNKLKLMRAPSSPPQGHRTALGRVQRRRACAWGRFNSAALIRVQWLENSFEQAPVTTVAATSFQLPPKSRWNVGKDFARVGPAFTLSHGFSSWCSVVVSFASEHGTVPGFSPV